VNRRCSMRWLSRVSQTAAVDLGLSRRGPHRTRCRVGGWAADRSVTKWPQRPVSTPRLTRENVADPKPATACRLLIKHVRPVLEACHDETHYPLGTVDRSLVGDVAEVAASPFKEVRRVIKEDSLVEDQAGALLRHRDLAKPVMPVIVHGEGQSPPLASLSGVPTSWTKRASNSTCSRCSGSRSSNQAVTSGGCSRTMLLFTRIVAGPHDVRIALRTAARRFPRRPAGRNHDSLARARSLRRHSPCSRRASRGRWAVVAARLYSRR